MVKLTRLNHSCVFINPDLIEHIDANSDTVVTLTNEQKFVVVETPDEIVDRIIEYRRLVLSRGPQHLTETIGQNG